ncbi:hypothetical protein GCM10012287_33330 [Streptomyces daqingensis]|uniref:Uncharacterized protein n=1 Tax=Streptomyces daqingensis TaxID=1472640 RepID=A0ABQ2MFR3_9ACTN|nr:hypothetical protein GCM10012287_33330 [Streptomyces daqingensis]
MDVDGDHFVAGARGFRTPSPVEQLLPADGSAGPEQQGGQESLFTDRSEFQADVPAPRLERPEQGESNSLTGIRG